MNRSGAGRTAAGLVALVGWVGMAVQLDASIGLTGSATAAIWKMLLFFTIIANLIAAIVMTGIALGRRGFGAPVIVGGVTIAMLLVGVVYALLLRGLLELSGDAALADLLLHSVTPVLVPLYWLAFAPKGGLKWRDPLVWAGLPILYFGYALLRGAIESVYPYPFMNVAQIGWGATLANALAMAAGFLLTGFLLVWLDRRQARTPG
jgi:hypothetical protein